MASKLKQVYRLSTIVAEVKEKHPPLELEIAEGKVLSVPAPQLWDEETLAVADDPVKLTKKLLGADFPAFIKAGGAVGVFAELLGDHFGNLGEFSAS